MNLQNNSDACVCTVITKSLSLGHALFHPICGKCFFCSCPTSRFNFLGSRITTFAVSDRNGRRIKVWQFAVVVVSVGFRGSFDVELVHFPSVERRRSPTKNSIRTILYDAWPLKQYCRLAIHYSNQVISEQQSKSSKADGSMVWIRIKSRRIFWRDITTRDMVNKGFRFCLL